MFLNWKPKSVISENISDILDNIDESKFTVQVHPVPKMQELESQQAKK